MINQIIDEKIAALQRAVAFLDKCRADQTSYVTGAHKDAIEWIESAARGVVGSLVWRLGTTHADGCWNWGPRHYDCALAHIKRTETGPERGPID